MQIRSKTWWYLWSYMLILDVFIPNFFLAINQTNSSASVIGGKWHHWEAAVFVTAALCILNQNIILFYLYTSVFVPKPYQAWSQCCHNSDLKTLSGGGIGQMFHSDITMHHFTRAVHQQGLFMESDLIAALWGCVCRHEIIHEVTFIPTLPPPAAEWVTEKFGHKNWNHTRYIAAISSRLPEVWITP